MIISRTPYRVSFFGGGTDYPAWYREHGGAVLATTIDKYCYLTSRFLPPFFDYQYRIVWSKLENCKDSSQIEHPVIRPMLDHLGIRRGVEIHHVGDLPARSGMGSSSSFTVGLMHALRALQGKMVGKSELMHDAIEFEQNVLHELVGSQDQVSAAVGGFNKVTFRRSGDIQVAPVVLPRARTAELDDHLMLFYTGIVRTASQVAKQYVTDLHAKRRQLRILEDLVDEAIELLAGDADITGFGQILDEAWRMKRSLGDGISTEELDGYYLRALRAGAIGGKITGAGGGGFLLLFVPVAHQSEVRAALPELVHVPFQFESSGSQIIFYDPEQDFSAAEAERATQPIRPFRESTQTIPYPSGADSVPSKSAARTAEGGPQHVGG